MSCLNFSSFFKQETQAEDDSLNLHQASSAQLTGVIF
jgi:hypothetical protein